jgi:selenocysteine lyase/cysteine desulfurase
VPLVARPDDPPATGTVLVSPLVDAVTDAVGARGDDVVVVRSDLADAAALLARRTPSGPDGVVALDGSPWADLTGRRVALAATLAGTVARVGDELARRSAELLAVPGSHPLTGEVLPLAELADVAHAHGARIAVDAGRLVAVGGVDMVAGDLDHVLFSGLDVHAPLAAGVLVGRGDWLEPRPALPRRPVSAALAAACREVDALPAGALAAHETFLRGRVLTLLRALPGVREVPGWPDARRHAGVVAFTVEGRDAVSVATMLAVHHGLPGVDVVALPVVALPVVAAAADAGAAVPGAVRAADAAAAVRLRLDAAWADEDVERLRDALEDVLTAA